MKGQEKERTFKKKKRSEREADKKRNQIMTGKRKEMIREVI